MDPNNMKLQEMRDFAKSNGLRGYTGLRKADMIKFLERTQTTTIEFVDDNHSPTNDSTPTLIPTEYIGPSPKPPPRTKKNALRKRLREWQDWLLSYIPEPIKSKTTEFKNKILSLFGGKPKYILEEKVRKTKRSIKKSKSAIKDSVMEYVIKAEGGEDAKTFLLNVKKKVVDFLNGQGDIKPRFILRCLMKKPDPSTGTLTKKEAHFSTKNTVKLANDDGEEIFMNGLEKILESIVAYQKEGSGWVIDRVIDLSIHIVKFRPLSGSSYIPLPKGLAGKEAIINMKNNDQECFKWSVTRALHPMEKNAERISRTLRMQAAKLDWSMFNFPVKVNDKKIVEFEKANGIGVNIFGYEDGLNEHKKVNTGVFPYRITKVNTEFSILKKKQKKIKVVDLLLIDNDTGDDDFTDIKQHYVWIKNKSRLLSKQTSKHKCKRFFCDYCVNGFPTEESLGKHLVNCHSDDPCRNSMPAEGSVIEFKNHYKSMEAPFAVFADFECFIKELEDKEFDENERYTKKYQIHDPSGYCYYIVCAVDGVYDSKIIRYTKQKKGEDIGQMFFDSLTGEVQKINDSIKHKKRMIFTKKDRDNYYQSEICYICRGELGKDKVRDHCHLTGKYRGAAHNKCNLQYRLPKFTPIFFHNLSGYDSHLFVKNLGVSEGDIRCIPNNEEKYISFSKMIKVSRAKYADGKMVEDYENHELRFLDSYKFMASSLGALAGNLDDDSCKNLVKFYSGEKFKLLRRKGVYPYDYSDSLDRLNEKELPPKEKFYSRLNNSNITDKDYKHAKEVWNKFGIRNMREYHDLYLESDVLLLADVFETFRKTCMDNYDLDPAWYYTSPGLSWDALFKTTGIKIDALTDPDMYLFFEKGTRGGISMISKRHGAANNPYMGDQYKNYKPDKYLTYLDANNLYGWAMSYPLPTEDFEWMEKEELEDWREIPCTVEVDLEYPKELYDLHNEYPLAAERLMIGKVQKLVPNLMDKEKYVVNHHTLKCYEKHGLVITKIHRGIKYKESPWMGTYINKNTELRAKATNDFERDFFKLMNNSVFGKTMENIRNRVNIKLLAREKLVNKYAMKPNFKKFTIFSENLIAIHLTKTDLLMDKPIYLGASILDISKTMMYDFHYNFIKEMYGNKAKLLFTDTDSLCYEIETTDFYKDINPYVKDMFDTSNYPKDHPSGITTGCNKKVLGMMKDECGGKVMTEFVGLRAKSYAYTMMDSTEDKKCKGIKKSVIKQNISFEDYKRCLFTGNSEMRKMSTIRSHKHVLYTEETNKVSLSDSDDKRVISDDRIHTHAIGHYSTGIGTENRKLKKI
jgi:hypothetical protein